MSKVLYADLFHTIGDFLDVRDLAVASCIDKSWNYYLSTRPVSLSSQLHLDIKSSEHCKYLLSNKLQGGIHMHITSVLLDKWPSPQMDDIMEILMMFCPTFSDMTRLAQTFPNLETLVSKVYISWFDGGMPGALGHPMPKLKTLDIENDRNIRTELFDTIASTMNKRYFPGWSMYTKQAAKRFPLLETFTIRWRDEYQTRSRMIYTAQ